jgi:hypothetical protein
LRLEPLERREVPATLISPTKLTFQDVDGDTVTVAFSKPVLTAANVASVFNFNPIGTPGDNSVPQQLRKIDLNLAANASGTSISVTSTPANGGDGFVNVGHIKADDLPLGVVTVDGDLGNIDCGDSTVLGQAIVSLTMRSWGQFGLTTQAAGGDLKSDVYGHVGAMVVKGNVFGRLDMTGLDDAKLQSLTIGGSLIGGSTSDSGNIANFGDIGAIVIRGDLVGGAGLRSGSIQTGEQGNIANITIGGSIFGGSGNQSGSIDAANAIGRVRVSGSVVGGGGDQSGQILGEEGIGRASIGGSVVGGAGRNSGVVTTFDALLGPVTVGGDIRGGSGINSGRVSSDSDFTSIFLRGSLIGGGASFSGSILGENMTVVTIGGDVRGDVGDSSGLVGTRDLTQLTIRGSVLGGSGQNSGEINPNRLTTARIAGDLAGGNGANSGAIFANSIGSLTIGGSVRSGLGTASGTIAADDRIGSIKVGGSLVGTGARPLLIQAGGSDSPSGPIDVVLGSLTVKGSVISTRIVAGITDQFVPVNADAQIGAVIVGGDWIGSSLTAGVNPVNTFFGDGDDTLATGGKNDAAVFSKIGSLTIGGQALGTATAGGDFFGIVAENIGLVKINGVSIPTAAGNGNDDFFVGPTADFKINEI